MSGGGDLFLLDLQKYPDAALEIRPEVCAANQSRIVPWSVLENMPVEIPGGVLVAWSGPAPRVNHPIFLGPRGLCRENSGGKYENERCSVCGSL